MQQPPTSDHAQETHECVAEAKHILNVNISRRNTEEKSGCTLRVNNVISFTKLNCPKLVDGAKSPHMDTTKKTSGIKHAAHPLLSMTLDPRIINDTSQNPKTDTLQVLRAHSQALTVALKRPVPLRMTLRPRNQQPLVCPQLHLPHRSNKINSTMSQVLPDSSTVTESVSKITMDVEQVRSPQPLQRSFLFDDQDEENALAAETSAFNASPSPEAHGQDGNNLSPYRHLHPGHVNDREPVAHTSPSRMRSYNVSSGPQATCEPDTSHSNLPTPPQLSSMKLPRKKRREEKRDAFEVLCNHVLATATVHQTPNIHAAAVVIPRTRADILAQRACMETVRRFALQLQHAFHAHDIFTAHRILHEVLCYHIDLETINSSNETRTLPSVVFQWMNASRQGWAIRAPLHWLKDVTRCAELLVMFWKTLIRKRCREEVVSNSGG